MNTHIRYIWLSLAIYIYIYIWIYIYLYTYGRRHRRTRVQASTGTKYTYIYIPTYTYLYTYICLSLDICRYIDMEYIERICVRHRFAGFDVGSRRRPRLPASAGAKHTYIYIPIFIQMTLSLDICRYIDMEYIKRICVRHRFAGFDVGSRRRPRLPASTGTNTYMYSYIYIGIYLHMSLTRYI